MLNMIKLIISSFLALNAYGAVMNNKKIPVIYREMWYAIPIDEPSIFRDSRLPYVIIHESGGPTCSTFIECSNRLKKLQMEDMQSKEDIRYNFLIGGDGAVYEGRGWYKNSIIIPGVDARSVSIAFIGSFTDDQLSTKAWDVFKNFLNYGVELNFLSETYQLLGHRQFRIIPEAYPIYQKQCPGQFVYQVIMNHPHWINKTIDVYISGGINSMNLYIHLEK